MNDQVLARREVVDLDNELFARESVTAVDASTGIQACGSNRVFAAARLAPRSPAHPRRYHGRSVAARGAAVTTAGVLSDQNARPINSDWRAGSAAFEGRSDATTIPRKSIWPSATVAVEQ